jgi:hypothetical protein
MGTVGSRTIASWAVPVSFVVLACIVGSMVPPSDSHTNLCRFGVVGPLYLLGLDHYEFLSQSSTRKSNPKFV